MQRLQEKEGWSQRRACRALKQSRSVQRYNRKRNQTAAEAEALIEQYPIFGSQKIGEIGESQTGTKAKTIAKAIQRSGGGKIPKNKVLYPRLTRTPHKEKEEGWASDFTTSRLYSGKKLVWLAVIDEVSRECHCLEAKNAWTGKKVGRKLEQLAQKIQPPKQLRVDNAILWRSADLRMRLRNINIEVGQTTKASPWENAKVESFFASFHREFIKRFALLNIRQANEAAALYRELYNTQRPHSALSGNPPAKYDNGNSIRDGTSKARTPDQIARNLKE